MEEKEIYTYHSRFVVRKRTDDSSEQALEDKFTSIDEFLNSFEKRDAEKPDRTQASAKKLRSK